MDSSALKEIYLHHYTFCVSREHGMDFIWWHIGDGVVLRLSMSKNALKRNFALTDHINLDKDSLGHMMIKQGLSIYDIAVIYINFDNKVFNLDYNY